jgi:hypothetical protein
MPHLPCGAYKAVDRYNAAIHEQFGNLGDPPDILPPVFFGKTQVAVDPAPDIVSVENLNHKIPCKQLFLEQSGQRGFSGAREPGEPDHFGILVQSSFLIFPLNNLMKNRINVFLILLHIPMLSSG